MTAYGIGYDLDLFSNFTQLSGRPGKGAEVGVRTVAIPRLQSSLSLWSLSLASELVFAGDAGTTEAGRPSHRYGVERANYYHRQPWPVRQRAAAGRAA